MGILKGRKEEGKKEKWTNLFRDLFLLVPRECSKLVKLGADEKGYCGLYNVRERGKGRGINRVLGMRTLPNLVKPPSLAIPLFH